MTSIRDIAKIAGVSAASVSRILNHDPTFSANKNTRARVIEIANQLNYAKEKSTRGVRRADDALTVALIVRHRPESEQADPYFREIRLGIEQEAAKWRLRTIRAFNMRDPKKDWQQLARYGAVIMIGEMTTPAVKKILALNENLILVDNYAEQTGCDRIQTDFASKTMEVLDKLYQLGHRKIAFIGGYASKVAEDGQVITYQDEVRAKSYRAWMKLHNLEKYSQVCQDTWRTASGLRLARQLLTSPERPTAIVVGSDPMAVGVYRAASELHLRIPQDVAVVSFDDLEMSAFMSPSLSSIHMNAREMGQIAIRLAKDHILKTRSMSVRIVCDSQLKLRESVGPRR